MESALLHVAVIGVNYKQGLFIRENIAQAFHTLAQTLPHCVLLVTCHRVELYFSHRDLQAQISYILHYLHSSYHYPKEIFYLFSEKNCFLHLVKVISGLDSVVVAETEIQGQVKRAYAQSQKLDGQLHFLFQKSLHIAKQMRRQFTAPASSWEQTLFDFASTTVGPKLSSVLFIGASRITMKSIKAWQHHVDTVALSSKRQLPKIPNIEMIPWNQLSCWNSFDLVIVATTAPAPVLTIPHTAVTTCVIDMSMPRMVDTSIGEVTRLFHLDHFFSYLSKQQQLCPVDLSLLVEKVDRQYHIFMEKIHSRALYDAQPYVELCVSLKISDKAS